MLMILETYVNDTEGHQFGDSGWYEPFTENRGELFRSLRREFGGCVSRVYQDVLIRRPAATHGVYRRGTYTVKTAGWVFSRRERYDDARPGDKTTYVREVWVQLREVPGDGSDPA
jgi:hypothetical protein